MTRAEPMADWAVYLMMAGIVISMILGKYYMFKDDPKKEKNDKPKDN